MLKKIKKAITILPIALMLFSITSCAGKKAETEAPVTPKERRELTDILSNPWKLYEKEPTELPGWEVVEYISGVSTLSDEDFYSYLKNTAYTDRYFYSVTNYENRKSLADITYGYELQRIDMETLEKKNFSLNFSDMTITGEGDIPTAAELNERTLTGRITVVSVDAFEDKLTMYMIDNRNQDTEKHFYKVIYTPDNNSAEFIDYTKALEKELNPDSEYFFIPMVKSGPDGSFCYIDKEERTFTVYNKEGKQTIEFDIDPFIEYVGSSADGIPIFSEPAGMKDVTFYGVDEAGKIPLYTGPMQNRKCGPDIYGNILMIKDGSLVSWNVGRGEVSKIYKFAGLDVYNCLGIIRNGNGEILVIYEDGDDGFLYRLNDEPHSDTVEIKILARFVDQKIENSAADYERTHPGVKMTVETVETNDDIEWGKIATAIKEGAGPDIIITDRERLRILASAGVVCPIDDMLSKEVKDGIFECVSRYGEIDSILYGIPCDAYLEAWFAKDDVLGKEAYSLEELMTAYEDYKNGRSGETVFECFNYTLPTWMIMGDLALRGIEYSEFLDWENGTCNFDSEEFCRLLRFCRENGTDGGESSKPFSSEAQMDMMHKGDAFLYVFAGSLGDYSKLMKNLGEGFHAVAFPYGAGIPAFVACSNAISVSDFSKNKEIAADFINFYAGEDCQVKYATNVWIRKDVLKNHVKDGHERIVYTDHGPDYADEPAFIISSKTTFPLDGQPDGTSYVNEFIELMDKAVPESVLYDIKSIILEEEQAYFSGMKTEYEVAKIIQSRVKIYLEERR